MRLVNRIVLPTVMLASLAWPAAALADDLPQFSMIQHLRVPLGETHSGDVYSLTAKTRISGLLDGDLVIWSGETRIDGRVDGDIIVGTQTFDLSGEAGDSVRVFAKSTVLDGTIEGDLIVFGADLTIGKEAHIKGNLVACTGTLEMAGTVDGDVKLTGGEANLDGPIGGDVRVSLDALQLGSAARIAGNLTYTTRKDLQADEGAVVAGETLRKEEPAEIEDDDGPTFLGVMWWIGYTLSTMLAGLVLVALFRRALPAVTRAVGGDPLMGALIGFGAFLVVPAASLLAILLVISAPLGIVALALFTVLLYVAKMPVAVWLGNTLMSWGGRAAPSPYLAVVVGLLLLRLVFLIPYLGGLLWLVAAWLGLGAMILATRTRLQQAA